MLYLVNNWLEKVGVLAVYNVLGTCFIRICVLTVPEWALGKRTRVAIARSETLKMPMSN